MITCAVDPGKHMCGVALIWESRWFVRYVSPREALQLVSGQKGIVELPRVRPDTPDPEDIVQVARIAGAVEFAMSDCKVVRPEGWKGSIPKPIHNARVMASARQLLGPALMGTIDTDLARIGALSHNAIDALGLLLFGLKMTNNKGMPYRMSP